MGTPTGRESFVAAIAAAPDDDTARLAFADWLDDHDEPAQAALIRHEVAAAKSGALPTLFPAGEEAAGHVDLGGELVKVVIAPAVEGVQWATDRGLVCYARCEESVWRELGPAVVKAHPVTMLDCGANGAELLRRARGGRS